MVVRSNPETFFDAQKAIKSITLGQAKGFYHFHKENGKSMVCLQNTEVDPSICCFGVEYRVPLLNKTILRIEGDARKETVSEKEIIAFYEALFNDTYAAIEYNGECFASPEYEVALRRAGFVRPLGMFSCPLTLVVDLTGEMKYKGNWRRNIKKGEKAALNFKTIPNPSDKDLESFSAMFSEMAQLKGLGYTLSTKSLKSMFTNDSSFQLFTVSEGDTIVAGRIVHIRKEFAIDVFAANSNQARNTGATFFIMDRIFKYLQANDVSSFDFARIPPSNHASDTVYQYKIGSGGTVKPYTGEWVRYKNKRLELLMLLYKIFRLKKQRY